MVSNYNMGQLDNMAGMDQAVNNSRNRATQASPLGVNYMYGIGTPTSITSGSNVALTAAQMGTGIVVVKPSASVNLSFDTAANIVAYMNANSAGAVVGDIMQVLIINGASSFTLAPQAGSGVTFDGNQSNTTIAANTSRLMYFRLTNVTSGSEAVVVYW